jgi:hypothetical protein
MQVSLATRSHPRPNLDERPKFKVVIIYEDGPAGKRAKYFYDKMIRELVDECDFSLELWSLRVLAIPEIGNSAAQAAAQADFVILSMHGKAELAPATRNWIGRWSRLIGDDVPALVVLLDQTETSGGKMTSTLRYLRNITDRKGISLYPHNNCLAV